jgi:hypothetical protein
VEEVGMKYWFGIVALLLLTFGITACSVSDEEVEESTPTIEGPALVMFYSDN